MTHITTVAHAVGSALVARGIDTVYGVVGSGNYEVTAALRAAGAQFIAARHEGAAVSMADAHFRVSGRMAAVSVHQGPGLTNTGTAIGEAVKSHIPLLVIAGAAALTGRRSNFRMDQESFAAALGAGAETVDTASTCIADAARAHQRALEEQRPIVVNLPIDVQEESAEVDPAGIPTRRETPRTVPEPAALERAAAAIRAAARPVIIAGRGAWLSGARAALEEIAEIIDAPLLTSAMANGLFRGNPRDRGICGGFSSPDAVAALTGTDLVLAVGCSLTTWTTRGGSIFDSDPAVVRIDSSAATVDTGTASEDLLCGDADATVSALVSMLRPADGTPPADSSSAARSWRGGSPVAAGSPVAPAGDDRGFLDGGAATARLDEILPLERTLVVDGGHFVGWPVQGLRVPDPAGFVFSSAGFQSIGLGMGSAVGASIARPERLTVLAVGDGGYQMGISELETMVRLQLPILVLVYNDAAYGAEVHHFGADEPYVDQVRFAPVDVAAAAAGAGARSATIHRVDELDRVAEWTRDLRGPFVLDLRIDPAQVGPWAAQDFLRH